MVRYGHSVSSWLPPQTRHCGVSSSPSESDDESELAADGACGDDEYNPPNIVIGTGGTRVPLPAFGGGGAPARGVGGTGGGAAGGGGGGAT